VDIFSPNETELRRILKVEGSDDITLAKMLMDSYPNLDILLKQGSNGSSYISKEERKVTSCAAVSDHKGKKIVDTTGAGDCFTGAFATAINMG
jgi:ribokinase